MLKKFMALWLCSSVRALQFVPGPRLVIEVGRSRMLGSSGLASADKEILFIRHGRSEMNEHNHQPGKQWGAHSFVDPGLFDTRLSPRGVAQAKRLGRSFLEADPCVDLLCSSPLTRALQTATHVFDSGRVSPKKRAVVSPLCAERVYLSSEVGRLHPELALEFPGFDYSTVAGGPWWYEGHATPEAHNDWRPMGKYLCHGEPFPTFTSRLELFKEWLVAQPERRIAVVSHWGVIHALTGRSAGNCEVVQQNLNELLARPMREATEDEIALSD